MADIKIQREHALGQLVGLRDHGSACLLQDLGARELGGLGWATTDLVNVVPNLQIGAADGGKNAHYILRWVNPKGEKGPWSETATATIGA